MVLLEAHALDACIVHPAGVGVGGLDLRPGIAVVADLKHVNRRSQQGLRNHFRVKVGGSSKVANRDIDYAVFLREGRKAYKQRG